MTESRRRAPHAGRRRSAGSGNVASIGAVASIVAVALIAGLVAVAIRSSRDDGDAGRAELPRSRAEPRAVVTATASTTVVLDRGQSSHPPFAPIPPDVLAELRADQRWNELEFAGGSRPPFVTVRPVTSTAALRQATDLAARDTAIACAVRGFWVETFGPLPVPASGAPQRLLRIYTPDIARYVLAFDPEQESATEAGPFAFCAADGRAFRLPDPEDAASSIPCGESEMQSWLDVSSARLAATQLLVRARADTPQRSPGTPRRALWFERGFPAWLAGIETPRGDAVAPDPGRVRMNRLLLEDVKLIRGSGRARADDSFREEAKKWTVPRILDVRSETDVLRVIGMPSRASVHRSVMWGFVHFLWNYDGGRYRTTVRASLDADLHGEDVTGAFRKAIAAIEPTTASGDWTVIQREFSWYWDKLLARGVGWKSNSQLDWWRTPTTPPEGRWAPPPPEEPEEHDEDEATDDAETK